MKNIVAKSLLAGVISSCLSLAVLYLLGMVLLIARGTKEPENGGIGWDPVAALTPIGFTLFLVAMFILGALWIYRRNAMAATP